MLQPNDLPIVCLPLELDDRAAVELIEFFRQITAALERQYSGQLLRHQQQQRPHDDEPF